MYRDDTFVINYDYSMFVSNLIEHSDTQFDRQQFRNFSHWRPPKREGTDLEWLQVQAYKFSANGS